MSDLPPGQLYLGELLDPPTRAPAGKRLQLDARDLTTHGVIVGMTGSGKTGLGTVLLEEALLSGIPALVLDPKGDMGNLALNFPELAAADFQPWMSESEARRQGLSTAELAAQTARRWADGLAGTGIEPTRMRRLQAAAPVTIYTPGSSSGVPLNVLGSLKAPPLDWDTQEETLRDEIEGFVSGLLGLAGIAADPISSREHILLANLIEHAWRAGRDLDLGSLIGQVQQPPLRQLGVFDVDTFFPEKDRHALALRLNGLVASPSFAAWLQGPDLDVAALLWAPDGRPRAAILYLAHLSEAERQLIVTLALSKLVTWMRGQSGTGELRALVYMDELYGFAPPSASPPSKKPILTLLKQARAFGLGLVLATQNPVDLDYKALSNAGTWLVGRLQTDRDKARILEGLTSAHAEVDVTQLDREITGLQKRQFLLQSAGRLSRPLLFQTRWAISYLHGPLTKDQVAQLMRDAPERLVETVPPAPAAPQQSTARAVATATAAVAGEGDTPVAPPVAAGVPVYYLHPAAAWARQVEAVPDGQRLQAALVARVSLRFDDTVAGVDQREEWEAVFWPLPGTFDPAAGLSVDYDARDFLPQPPAGAAYRLPDAPLGSAAYFKDAATALKRHLLHQRTVGVWQNAALKLCSRVGETEEEFARRCDRSAQEAADRETAAIRQRLERKMDSVRQAMAAAQRRADELEADRAAKSREVWVAGAGDLMTALLGGRRTTRGLASRAARGISSASARQSRAARAGERVASAEAKVADKQLELEVLERDLAEEIRAIDARWAARATAIEARQIGLESTDISVDEVAVVWVPVS
jgi:DNA helicase HerA-like ATPase